MGDMGTRNVNCRNSDLRHKGLIKKRGYNLTFQELFSLPLPLHHSNFFSPSGKLSFFFIQSGMLRGLENFHFLLCMPMSLESCTRDRDLWVPEMMIQLDFTVIPGSTVFQMLVQERASDAEQILGRHTYCHGKPAMFHREN